MKKNKLGSSSRRILLEVFIILIFTLELQGTLAEDNVEEIAKARADAAAAAAELGEPDIGVEDLEGKHIAPSKCPNVDDHHGRWEGTRKVGEGYKLTCAPGYEVIGTRTGRKPGKRSAIMVCPPTLEWPEDLWCQDVDDCAGLKHGCGAMGVCMDLVAGYDCNCERGYPRKKGPDGEVVCGDSAEDPKICGGHTCGAYGICVDLRGNISDFGTTPKSLNITPLEQIAAASYRCECVDGYYDNGELCVPRNCGMLVDALGTWDGDTHTGGQYTLKCSAGASVWGGALSQITITCGNNGKWLSHPECVNPVQTELDERLESAKYWMNVGMVFVCVCSAAMAAGLTLGLVSLDPFGLEVLLSTRASDYPAGEGRKRLKRDQESARRMLPLVKDHHMLLVTLLLFNTVANEALPLFLDELVSPLMAVFLSVSVVLICGEILPSAIFTGTYQFSIAAAFVPFVGALQFIFAPIAMPIAQLLDKLVPEDEDESLKYSRAELRALLQLHGRIPASRRPTEERETMDEAASNAAAQLLHRPSDEEIEARAASLAERAQASLVATRRMSEMQAADGLAEAVPNPSASTSPSLLPSQGRRLSAASAASASSGISGSGEAPSLDLEQGAGHQQHLAPPHHAQPHAHPLLHPNQHLGHQRGGHHQHHHQHHHHHKHQQHSPSEEMGMSAASGSEGLPGVTRREVHLAPLPVDDMSMYRSNASSAVRFAHGQDVVPIDYDEYQSSAPYRSDALEGGNEDEDDDEELKKAVLSEDEVTLMNGTFVLRELKLSDQDKEDEDRFWHRPHWLTASSYDLAADVLKQIKPGQYFVLLVDDPPRGNLTVACEVVGALTMDEVLKGGRRKLGDVARSPRVFVSSNSSVLLALQALLDARSSIGIVVRSEETSALPAPEELESGEVIGVVAVSDLLSHILKGDPDDGTTIVDEEQFSESEESLRLLHSRRRMRIGSRMVLMNTKNKETMAKPPVIPEVLAQPSMRKRSITATLLRSSSMDMESGRSSWQEYASRRTTPPGGGYHRTNSM